MPRVRILVGDVKCVRQADKYGKDDVYWLANLREGSAVDPDHTDMARLIFDKHYDTSLPEMLSIGAGETARFGKNVLFDRDCAPGSYIYGKVHFMERDTPIANYFSKIVGVIGLIIAGIGVGAAVGFGAGYVVAGLEGAIGGGAMVALGIALLGFFVGAGFDLIGGKDNDAHLGGMPIVIGPVAGPPPDAEKATWPLRMLPSGKLQVVDVHGAELVKYQSSHGVTHLHHEAGHLYETSVQIEVTGGNAGVGASRTRSASRVDA